MQKSMKEDLLEIFYVLKKQKSFFFAVLRCKILMFYAYFCNHIILE